MSKFIVELWLDGYVDEAERAKAEEEFIYEQLNFTASSVKITRIPEPAPAGLPAKEEEKSER